MHLQLSAAPPFDPSDCCKRDSALTQSVSRTHPPPAVQGAVSTSSHPVQSSLHCLRAGKQTQNLGQKRSFGSCVLDGMLPFTQLGEDGGKYKGAFFFPLLLGMPGFNYSRKSGRKTEMEQDGPVAAEAYPVNQAKSHQEKATSLAAASVPVRNLLESELMLNFFSHYYYNHVKHSIEHSGQCKKE